MWFYSKISSESDQKWSWTISFIWWYCWRLVFFRKTKCIRLVMMHHACPMARAPVLMFILWDQYLKVINCNTPKQLVSKIFNVSFISVLLWKFKLHLVDKGGTKHVALFKNYNICDNDLVFQFQNRLQILRLQRLWMASLLNYHWKTMPANMSYFSFIHWICESIRSTSFQHICGQINK